MSHMNFLDKKEKEDLQARHIPKKIGNFILLQNQ